MVRILVKKTENKKEQHRTAEELMRLLVLEFGGQMPVNYTKNTHGKPYLTPPNESLYVNWSHSGIYAACALTDHEVGIDLQAAQMEPKENLVRRVLRPQELSFYEKAPAEEKKHLFYAYWTLKESFLKALGTGFHTPLEKFYIDMEGKAPKIIQQINKQDYNCRLIEFQDKEYAAAVCCEGDIGTIVIDYIEN